MKEDFLIVKKFKDLIHLLDRGLYRFCHIASWLPILWQDHDWDSGFMLRIFRHKIHRMRIHFETHHIICDWEKVAKELLVAENLLDRLIKDDYCDEEWERHCQAFGEPGHNSYTDEKGMTVWPSTAGTLEGADSKRIFDKAMQLRKQDREMLWDLICRKSETWWD